MTDAQTEARAIWVEKREQLLDVMKDAAKGETKTVLRDQIANLTATNAELREQVERQERTINFLNDRAEAAERAAVKVLPDDSPRAVLLEIGNQIHNIATELQNNEEVSGRLADLRNRIWDAAQQASTLSPAESEPEQEAVKPKHIGMIAHIDHGKTALTAAVAALTAAMEAKR